MKYIAVLSVISLFFGLVWFVNAENDQLNDNVVKLCKSLRSQEFSVRQNSEAKLLALKINEEQALLDNLTDLMQGKDIDTSYGSSFYYTVEMIGKLRIRAAIADLIKKIDFKVDESTLPDWEKKSMNSYYPVAVAISEIGDPSVWFYMLAQLKEEKRKSADLQQTVDILKKSVAIFVQDNRK